MQVHSSGFDKPIGEADCFSLHETITSNDVKKLSEYLTKKDQKGLLTSLSRTYGEIKARNIDLSLEIQYVIEKKLGDIQFMNEPITSQKYNPMKYHDFTCSLINILKDKYDREEDIDLTFITYLRMIGQHIWKLKFSKAYWNIPLKEIEFYIAKYLDTLLNFKNVDIIYKLILNKNSLLNHLGHIRNELLKINAGKTKSSAQPDLRKLFKHLYTDVDALRDFYSLERIYTITQIASSADLQKDPTRGRLLIQRALQIIGEYIKNSDKTTNVSDTAETDLSTCMSPNLRQTLKHNRDKLSHFIAKKELLQNLNIFNELQCDLRKFNNSICYIMYIQKIKIMKLFLNTILELDSFPNYLIEIRRVYNENKQQNIQDNYHERQPQPEELTIIKDLVNSFWQKVQNVLKAAKNRKYEKMYSEVTCLIENYEKRDKDLQVTYIRYINKIFKMLTPNHDLEDIKTLARTCLSGMSALEPRSLYDQIFTKLRELHEEYCTNMDYDNEGFAYPDERVLDVINIINEIFYYLNLRLHNANGIEKMKELLDNADKTFDKTLYEENLETLKQVLRPVLQECSGYSLKICIESNLMAPLEIVVFDLLQMLDKQKKLGSNHEFIVQHMPILSGKELRNYLAHGDILIDALPYKPCISIICHAETLLEQMNDIANEPNLKVGCRPNLQEIAYPNYFKEWIRDTTWQTDDDELCNLKPWSTIKSVIHSAIQVNNKAKLLDLIKSFQSDTKCIDKSLSTSLLLFAIFLGHQEIVEIIIKTCNIDTKSDRTFLHACLSYKQEEIALWLTDLDGHAMSDKTTLALAIENGCLRIVERIMFTSTETNYQWTDLIAIAAENNQWNVIKYFASKNDRLLQDHSRIIMQQASQYGHHDIVKKMFENHDITAEMNCKDDNGKTLLHLAAESGHENIIDFFINKGADRSEKDHFGRTPLHWACYNNHDKAAEILLLPDAKLELEKDNDGKCPLHLATENGNIPKCIKLFAFFNEFHPGLLKNCLTSDNRTALHLAAQNGSLELVEELVEKYETDVNAKDINYETALIIAAKKGFSDIIDCLKSNGADLRQKNKKQNYPAIAFAAMYGHLDILYKLFDHKDSLIDIKSQQPVSKWQALHFVVQNGYADILNVLLDRQVDVNAKFRDGGTALHIASPRAEHKHIVELLIKNGADVNALMDDLSPLRAASSSGNTEIVELLLNNEANVNFTSSDKVSPLHVACWKGHLETVKLLLNRGADINMAEVDEGWTALHFAVYAGSFEIMRILLDHNADQYAKDNKNRHILDIARDHEHDNIIEFLEATYDFPHD